MSNKMKTYISTTTNGTGLWTNRSANIKINELQIHHVSRNTEKLNVFSGELRAFFSTKDWDVNKHGLIYTDRGWLKDFRNKLILSGFSKKAANSVHYSEQGMQSKNYVSLDAGSEFIKEFAVLSVFKDIEQY